MGTFDIESLVNLEQTFYDTGYEEGFAHGRNHGLIEGRALGTDKGFEIWEELGYYEGFALTWQAIYAKQGRSDERAMHHVTRLVNLIAQFPQANPSVTVPSDVDISQLLGHIRSRYKAFCSTLGIRPSYRAIHAAETASHPDIDSSISPNDSRRNRTIWKLDHDVTRPKEHGLSF